MSPRATLLFPLLAPVLGLAAALMVPPLAPLAGPSEPKAAPIDFYGKKVTLLKLFGQTRWGDCSPGRVDGTKIYHAAGVLVDRSLSPNAIYVADTGNNRILGFRSANSKKADRVFGQPDEFGSAPNGDCNTGRFARPSRTSLCLTDVPGNTNLAEQWLRLNFDVDGQGNLYVPDHGNNRVLVYRAPFSADKVGGKGDVVPDLVLGQEDFTSNGINCGMGPHKRDARSLFLSYGNRHGFDHVSSRGVSVDPKGNVWVADTFNSRVLRFPKGKTTADLVLGQPTFAAGAPARDVATAPLDRMGTPTLARVSPDSGELYVVDEYPGGFPARVLVFKPPFKSGMAAARTFAPKQRRAGDFAAGYRFTHCTGLVFNSVKTDEWVGAEKKARYRDGVVWLHDSTRTLLLDRDGNVLLAIGAPDRVTLGGRYDSYERSGLSPFEPFNLVAPGGMIGLDSENNIYLADEHAHRISRYALPYRARKTAKGLALPKSNGGLFPGTMPNTVGPAHLHADRFGALAFKDQLIVRDHQRYLVWTNYLGKRAGAPANLIVGQDDGWSLKRRNHVMGRSAHAIDHKDRLWATGEHGKLMAYQLPFKAGAGPLRKLVALHWADRPAEEVDYRCDVALAFEPRTKCLWVFDSARHRLLRARVPDDPSAKLLVDCVLGQKNRTDGQVNRGLAAPGPASFGDVNAVKFDRKGNLFVVDNTYELHDNGRVLAFLAEDLRGMKGLFPAIEAKKVYVAERFDQPVHKRTFLKGEHPRSPVSVAFNRRNEMVIGNDGYFEGPPEKRNLNQLFLYRRPLEKATPDAVIQLPLGAPGEIAFDDRDNLIVQDHTYNKVWAINFDRDPAWLRECNAKGTR